MLLLAIVPFAFYVATYVGRLDGSVLAWPWAEGSWLRAFVERQADMLALQADKPSTSTTPLALPMTERALPYVLERRGDSVRELLVFGNPLLWWGGFVAVAFAAWRARRGDGAAAATVAVGFLAAFAGWLFLTLMRSPVFLYHAVPVAPFLYLALAYLYAQVATVRASRLAAGGVLAVSIAAFAFYLPILSSRELDRGQWRPRACSAQALWLDPRPQYGLGAARPEPAP